MVTSNMSRAGHAARVELLVNSENAKQSGLLMDSVVMADNLATIHLSEINRIIGRIPMSAIDSALRLVLALPLAP